jgi:hypothetical protein
MSISIICKKSQYFKEQKNNQFKNVELMPKR